VLNYAVCLVLIINLFYKLDLQGYPNLQSAFSPQSKKCSYDHLAHNRCTDVFVLALQKLPQLGPQTYVLNGTGSKCKLLLLQPIYDALGSDMVAALPGFHAFTGCDTTGSCSGKARIYVGKHFRKLANQFSVLLPMLAKVHNCKMKISYFWRNLYVAFASQRVKRRAFRRYGHMVEHLQTCAGRSRETTTDSCCLVATYSMHSLLVYDLV